MQHLVLLCLLLSSLLLTGCAPLIVGGVSKSSYGVYQDKRLMDTMVADSNICSYIRGEVAKKEAWKSLSLGIYSYYGRVFLVGSISDPKLQQQIQNIATKTPGVHAVTTHWFPPGKGQNNMLVATKLRSNLIGASGVISSRVDTEIDAGRVVLLGVVGSEEEKERIVRVARKTSGVTSVTSYLMLPQ